MSRNIIRKPQKFPVFPAKPIAGATEKSAFGKERGCLKKHEIAEIYEQSGDNCEQKHIEDLMNNDDSERMPAHKPKRRVPLPVERGQMRLSGGIQKRYDRGARERDPEVRDQREIIAHIHPVRKVHMKHHQDVVLRRFDTI